MESVGVAGVDTGRIGIQVEIKIGGIDETGVVIYIMVGIAGGIVAEMFNATVGSGAA